MTRHLLIRDDSGVENMVEETGLLAEKSLHDVLDRHPELIPADDLEIGNPIVVGRESGLETGYADLVLLDREGRLCLVEVKKEGNPDTRRVIAQLLDYAAALWQMSADVFERTVLHPHLRATGVAEQDLPDLTEFATERFGPSDDDSDEDEFADFPRALEQTLASGTFRLVVVAPSIPPGVQQVIEYLNAQGLLIYGLEVSFFSGPAECFVPRLVVKPRVTETRKLTATSSAPIAEEDFLQALPDRVRAPAAQFLQDAEVSRGRIRWTSYGPSVRADRTPERVLSWLEKKRFTVTVKPFVGYPTQPFTDARTSTAQLGVGSISSDDWYWIARFDEVTDGQLEAAFEIALDLVKALATPVTFQPIAAPITVEFQRNDHNIWAKSVPPLNEHVGHWLQGTLEETASSSQASITLEPLANNSPGWKPQFNPTPDELVWPTGELHGTYNLTVTALGTPQA